MASNVLIDLLVRETLATLYIVLVSSSLSYLFGIPLGIILYSSDKGSIKDNKLVNGVVGIVVNIVRSVPFIILLIYIIPLTRLLVRTSIGSTATIVPLFVSATPFVARMVESSLKEVDNGVIEAAKAMGSSPWQIITKVLLPEAVPSLIVGATITVTTILGYATMAAFVGGGGLGAIAINYGYYRYQYDVMTYTVIILIIIVQAFQGIGMTLAHKIDKRIKQ